MKNSLKKLLIVLLMTTLVCTACGKDDTRKVINHDELVKYNETWIEEDNRTSELGEFTENMIIEEFFSDCFIGKNTDENGNEFRYKINYREEDTIIREFTLNDSITVTFENVSGEAGTDKYEGNLVNISFNVSDLNSSAKEYKYPVADKPVIYLYPEEITKVNVKIEFSNGDFTCTYPKYEDNEGWNVTAYPGGKLVDANGKEYNYLYWEGSYDINWDFTRGFCVKGEDSAEFLEKVLAEIGLTRQEANEFIVYWLPIMEQNKYNVVSFQTDLYEEYAGLQITPEPDGVLRVFMTFYQSDENVSIEPQSFETFEREGFCVVEWGGSMVK